ncbi:MAG: AraC-like DNA-binding protein [Flavobacteriales bacterium]|jgi:AraC-like DNA-binding protein
MDGTFISRSPKSEKLFGFISHYYFHESKNSNDQNAFFYYPNTKNALTIYKNSKLEVVQGSHTRTTPSDPGYSFNYAQLFNSIGKAEIIGAFNRVGVVFEPMGLNHFVSEDLSNVINKGININFNYFKDSLSGVLDLVYSEENIEIKVELLDEYFISQFVGFKEKRLLQIRDMVIRSESKLTVNELSSQLDISRKTLLRMFKRHLDCTPTEYLTLMQFRKAIEIYNASKGDTSLTNVALDSLYCDQSSFIHHFKKVTNFNPKEFFKNVAQFGNHPTFWILD